MRYVLEILTYRGWNHDTDEDGRPLPPVSRKEARAALGRAKEWQRDNCRWGCEAYPLRLRIVNATARPNRKARQERKRRWVTDYRTDRCYGGPEEGGWWFDTGEPVKGTCASFYSEERARAEQDRRNELNDAFNKARGAYGDISSVVCDYALRTHVDPEPPRPYPDQTPRYC